MQDMDIPSVSRLSMSNNIFITELKQWCLKGETYGIETATHQSDENLLIQGLKTWLHRIVANRFAPNGRWATAGPLSAICARELN